MRARDPRGIQCTCSRRLNEPRRSRRQVDPGLAPSDRTSPSALQRVCFVSNARNDCPRHASGGPPDHSPYDEDTLLAEVDSLLALERTSFAEPATPAGQRPYATSPFPTTVEAELADAQALLQRERELTALPAPRTVRLAGCAAADRAARRRLPARRKGHLRPSRASPVLRRSRDRPALFWPPFDPRHSAQAPRIGGRAGHHNRRVGAGDRTGRGRAHDHRTGTGDDRGRGWGRGRLNARSRCRVWRICRTDARRHRLVCGRIERDQCCSIDARLLTPHRIELSSLHACARARAPTARCSAPMNTHGLHVPLPAAIDEARRAGRQSIALASVSLSLRMR